jgi:hypothetical protein
MIPDADSEPARLPLLQLPAPLDFAQCRGPHMGAAGLTAAESAFLQPNQDGGPWNQGLRALEIAAAPAEVHQPGVEEIRFVKIRPFDDGIAMLAVFTPLF